MFRTVCKDERKTDLLPCRYKCSNQVVAVSRSGRVLLGVFKCSTIMSMDGSSLTPSRERSRRKAAETCLKPSFSQTGDANTCENMLTSSQASEAINYATSFKHASGPPSVGINAISMKPSGL